MIAVGGPRSEEVGVVLSNLMYGTGGLRLPVATGVNGTRVRSAAPQPVLTAPRGAPV